MANDKSIAVSFRVPEYMMSYQNCRRLGNYVDVSIHCKHPNTTDLTAYSAHSLLLSSASPYLNLLLESSFRDKFNCSKNYSKSPVKIVQHNELFQFDPSCSYNKIDNSLQFCLENSCCNTMPYLENGDFSCNYMGFKYINERCTHGTVTIKSLLSDANDIILIVKGLDPVYFKYILCTIYNEDFVLDESHIKKFLNFIKKMEISTFEILEEKIMNLVSNVQENGVFNPALNIEHNAWLNVSFKKLLQDEPSHYAADKSLQNCKNYVTIFEIQNSDKHHERELNGYHQHNEEKNTLLDLSFRSQNSSQNQICHENNIPARDFIQDIQYCKFDLAESHHRDTIENNLYSCNEKNTVKYRNIEQKEWVNFSMLSKNVMKRNNNLCKKDNYNYVKKWNNPELNNDDNMMENCVNFSIWNNLNFLQYQNYNLYSDKISTSAKNFNFRIENLIRNNIKHMEEEGSSLSSTVTTANPLNQNLPLTQQSVNNMVIEADCFATSQTNCNFTSKVYSSVPFLHDASNLVNPLMKAKQVNGCSSHVAIINEFQTFSVVNSSENEQPNLVSQIEPFSEETLRHDVTQDVNSCKKSMNKNVTKINLKDEECDTFETDQFCQDNDIIDKELTDKVSDSSSGPSSLITYTDHNKGIKNEFLSKCVTNEISARKPTSSQLQWKCFPKNLSILCKKIKMKKRLKGNDGNIHKSVKYFPKVSKCSSSVSSPLTPMNTIPSLKPLKGITNNGYLQFKGDKMKQRKSSGQGLKCALVKGHQSTLPLNNKHAEKSARKTVNKKNDHFLQIKDNLNSLSFQEPFREKEQKLIKLNLQQTFKNKKELTKSDQLDLDLKESSKGDSDITKDCALVCNLVDDTQIKNDSPNIIKYKVHEGTLCESTTLEPKLISVSLENNLKCVDQDFTSTMTCIICSFNAVLLTEMFEHVKLRHYNGIIKNSCCFDKQCPIRPSHHDFYEHIKHHIMKLQHQCKKCSFSSKTPQGIRTHSIAHEKYDLMNKERKIKAIETTNTAIKATTSNFTRNIEKRRKYFDDRIPAKKICPNKANEHMFAINNNKQEACSDHLKDRLNIKNVLATKLLGKFSCGIVDRHQKYPERYKLCLLKAAESNFSSFLSCFALKKSQCHIPDSHLQKKVKPSLKNKTSKVLKNENSLMSKNKSKYPLKFKNKTVNSNKRETLEARKNEKSENFNLKKIVKKKHGLGGTLIKKKLFKMVDTSEDKETRIIEVNENGKTIEFSCIICRTVQKSCEKLAAHYVEEHRFALPFICPFKNCNVNLSCPAQLQNHVISHTRQSRFVCSTCNYSCPSKNGISIHSKMHKETSSEPFSQRY